MQDRSKFTTHCSRISEDMFCALSYVTMLPAVVMLLLPSTAHSSRIRFHACQSILLNWLLMTAAFFLHLRAGLDQLLGRGDGALFDVTARILCMMIWAFASLRIGAGREFRLPILAALAEKQSHGVLFRRILARSNSLNSSTNLSSPVRDKFSILTNGSRLKAAVVPSALEDR